MPSDKYKKPYGREKKKSIWAKMVKKIEEGVGNVGDYLKPGDNLGKQISDTASRGFKKKEDK